MRVECLDAAAKLVPCLIAVLALSPPAAGAVKPCALFSDNAVLQQGIGMPVWGTADPGEKVTVCFEGQSASATAGKDGRWTVRLKPLKASGPFTMKINALELKNVLVGEVWVCSGQSNMQMALSQAENAQAAIDASADSMLRLFTVPRVFSNEPAGEMKAAWNECGPATVKDFSAVGYFFGRDLRKALGVPVGLINCSWGGTRIQAWTPPDCLDTATLAQPFKDQNSPAALYCGMVSPLLPFPIRGAIWYQGESNAGEAFRYRSLMPTMIECWRKAWGLGEFPFLMVQLAPYGAVPTRPVESAWAELREAQLLTTGTCPNTAMAVITDVGDPKDIHPKKKEPVGARLALAARAIAYGEKIVYQGPVYKSLQVKGDRAILTFDSSGGGLEARGGELTGFTVCGPDHKFYNARATIRSDKVIVSAPEVTRPVAVRYGWSDCPIVNLFNKAGLPASPFRTDDFPMITAPK